MEPRNDGTPSSPAKPAASGERLIASLPPARQSPISVFLPSADRPADPGRGHAVALDLDNPRFHYENLGINVAHKPGHGSQVKYGPGNTMLVGGQSFELAQFHIHAPSEHTINGKQFPAEMHFVHQDRDGNRAVVGVLLSEGAHNDAAQALLGHLEGSRPAAGPAPTPANERRVFDPRTLYPQEHTTVRYPGSLTTPPFDENVQWLVMDRAIEVSPAQLKALKSFAGDSRETQPLNGRVVTVDISPHDRR